MSVIKALIQSPSGADVFCTFGHPACKSRNDPCDQYGPMGPPTDRAASFSVSKAETFFMLASLSMRGGPNA